MKNPRRAPKGAQAASQRVTLVNALGLHLRAAAQFIRVANTFACEITVDRNGKSVNGKSIMGLMTLAAPCGSELLLSAKGKDASLALKALAGLVDQKFGEKA